MYIVVVDKENLPQNVRMRSLSEQWTSSIRRKTPRYRQCLLCLPETLLEEQGIEDNADLTSSTIRNRAELSNRSI